MVEVATSRQIIIVYTEHPILGSLLIPYLANKQNDNSLILSEQAFYASPETLLRMNPAERKAIKIASNYTDRHLMTVFSKEKTVATFFRKLSEDPKKLQKIVRPNIEKNLLEMITLIRNGELPLYQKEMGKKILYPHNIYHINNQPVDTSFFFHKDDKIFSYELTCHYNKQPLEIRDLKPIIMLTSYPINILLGMELFSFPYLRYSYLLPFTKKRRISVNASLSEKYIDNILIPISRHHDITTEGINMIREKRTCEPLIIIEKTIYNYELLKIVFRYKSQTFPPADFSITKNRFLLLQKEKIGDSSIHYFDRDIDIENSSIQLLLNLGLQRVDNSFFKISKDSEIKDSFTWITQYREMLQNKFQVINSTGKAAYCLDNFHIEQDIKEKPDWFDLNITVIIGKFNIPFSKFRKYILGGKKEYILPNGDVFILPTEWFSKYTDLMEISDNTEKGIRLKNSYVGVLESFINKNQEEYKEMIPSSISKIELLPTPTEIKAILRPYQQKGYSWLMNLYKRNLGSCLADDMGLGKTLQTLTMLQRIYEKTKDIEKKRSSLIVVPKSLLHNWLQETMRFTTLTIFEYNSTSVITKEQPEQIFEKYNLILTSYGMMRNNIDILSLYEFEYIILDESQYIKNNSSLTFRSAIQLRAKHRLALTGTPIENSLNDLWSQFNFLQPDLLGDESTFQKEYITPIVQKKHHKEEQLRQLLAPFILRRNKLDVAPELPPLTEEIIYCEMAEAQEELYQQEKNSLRNLLLQQTYSPDTPHKQSINVLNGILRLRELSCHPRLVFPDSIDISGKMEQIIETFDTLRSEGHKVLIFSSFVKHLNLIAEAFDKNNWKYATLTGQTTNRSEAITYFNNQIDVQAFLISLKAGGVGLNLTQADYVFIIDPWWNPATEAQAIARAHRIGQSKRVIAYRFITQDSIEEKMIKLQEEKRTLANNLITNSDSLPELTNNEWIELLH